MRPHGQALASIGIGALVLATACSSTSPNGKADHAAAEVRPFPPDCDHRRAPVDELGLVPGRYHSGGILTGMLVDLTAGGRFELTAWACMGPDTRVSGTWAQDRARVSFSKPLGSLYQEPHDVVLTADGLPAIHMQPGPDHCYALVLVVHEPPTELPPPPPVPTDQPPPPAR